jgi:hypothetical protein
MSFNDYHKIVLFGDSITERSFEQHRYGSLKLWFFLSYALLFYFKLSPELTFFRLLAVLVLGQLYQMVSFLIIDLYIRFILTLRKSLQT